jgi:hypothetical protein
MPNFDGTGPAAKGPLTGKGKGKCQDEITAKMCPRGKNRLRCCEIQKKENNNENI